MDMHDPEEQQLEQESGETTEETENASGEPALIDATASESDDMPVVDKESAPAEETAVEETAVEETVVEETFVEEAAVEEKTVEETTVEETEAEETTVEDIVVEEVAVEEKTAEETTAEETEAEETDVEGNTSEETSVEDIAAEDDEDPSDWFVIHCYSGYENKVRHNLEQRIETMGMKNMIFDVVVPTQEEIEVKDGKRRTVERHIFPGYVLVNMILTEESWYVVRNTPGVTGFVGMGNEPTPLRPEEVLQIVKRMEADAPTVKVTFKVGERVRIIDGPFNDFRGVVDEIDMERTKVRVLVNFFGRETPVELDFLQVERA
jgi:transcriptional antiterminator NusG